MSEFEPAIGGAPVSRRGALKGAAVAIGAAAVWAEPSIKGLARRPAYAAGGSTPMQFTMPTIAQFKTGNGAGTGLPTTVYADATSGLVVELRGPQADGSHTNTDPTGTYTLTASLPGCTCVWVDPLAADAIIRRKDTGTPSIGANAGGGVISWNWTGAEIANRFETTGPLVIECS